MLIEQALLDWMSGQMGCTYLSDLRYLSLGKRRQLAGKLESLALREEDLRDWNDALVYLTGASPETTAQNAKKQLVLLLSSGCAKNGTGSNTIQG